MTDRRIRRRSLLLAGMAMAAGVATQRPDRATAATADDTATTGGDQSYDDQSYDDIYDAFLFGYALVANEIGLLPRTNVTRAGYDGAPVNQLKLAKSLEDDGLTNGPNMETVYASAVLDLSGEPVIVSKPGVDPDRYFGLLVTSSRGAVMQPLGTQGLGGQGATAYGLVGPHCTTKLPKGVQKVTVTSDLAFLMIRIRQFSDVENDYATVDALQKQIDIRPLSAYGDTDYVPPAGTVDPSLDYNVYTEKAGLTVVEFFARYNRLSAENPPEDAYADLAACFEKYGIGPGLTFTLDGFDPDLADRLNAVPHDFESDFPEYYAKYSYTEDGWATVDGDALAVGGDYHVRDAYYYYQPPSVNPPAVFKGYGTQVDSDGNALDGSHTYRIRFQKDAFPPFREGGFWTLIAYYGVQMDVPVNPIGRYKINDRSALAANADGTTDVYLQPDAPTTTPESNWLPTAAGAFMYVMRVYCPQDSALNGDWQAPRLEKMPTAV
ncbi:DUF1214 domain-containing protein [Streptomyces sp. NPDC048277]|uniref:DUF1214 domain-containing protein n=1 Tax=Streptomyces sp. NPDC048277 TaxID=3155027 RepID=UPI0033C968BE